MMSNKHGHSNRVAPKKLSKHAVTRIRQRGLCEDDLALIYQTGEEFKDGYLMSARAVNEQISRLKAEIQQLERLRGVVLIEQQNTFVTVYRADRKRCKRILRHGISQVPSNKEVYHENRI